MTFTHRVDEELLAHRKAHGQGVHEGRAEGIARAPVAGDGLLHVHEQAAHDEFGHGAGWYRVREAEVCTHKKARQVAGFAQGAGRDQPPWNFTTSGTIRSATMLMILISGFTAGPAVSL